MWSLLKSLGLIPSRLPDLKKSGGTRRKLLASLMALSLLCGGLGVAEASVHVEESGETYEVMTRQEVTAELDKKVSTETADANYAKATDVTANTKDIATNKANITALRSELGNKADATALDGKANTSLNNLDDAGKAVIKGMMKDELTKKADTTALADYAKTTDVNTALDKKADKAITLDGYGITDAYTKEKTDELLNTKANAADVYRRGDIDTKLEDVYSKTEVDGKITGEENARNIAIQTAISGEAENRKNAIDAAIAKEVADRNQAIKIEVDKEANARDTAIANAKNDLQTKITEEKTAREAAIDMLKTKDTALEGKINTLDASSVKYDNATVKDKITLGLGGAGRTTITNLKDANLSDSSTDAVTGKQLNKTNEDLKTEAQTREDKDTLLSNRADALEKNTGGITRSDAKDETYIENTVTVDNKGNIEAKGKVTANGVDAGAGDITTKGAVNSGTLEVTNTSHFKGDVTMDNKLNVTGNTSLNNTDVGGALNVTGASDLKGNVTLGKNAANTVTVNGKSDFKEAVEMDNGLTVDKGLTVTSGDTTLKGKLTVTGEADLKNITVGGTLGVTGATTLSGELTAKENATFEKDAKVGKNLTVDGTTNLKDTTVTGNLNVTGTITTDKMIFGDKATNNYTEIDKGHITSKNDVLAGDATKKSSSMELDYSKLEVGVADKDSNGHLTMTADKTSIKNSDLAGKNYSEIVADKDSVKTTVKDEEDNTTSTKSSATEIRNYAKDAAGNKTNNVQTATQNKSWAKDKDGNESSIVQTGKDITNTAQNGTITNDAQNIVNNATGDMTNTVGGKLTTTVTGQATEDFNGGLDTNVKGTENHTVNGKQINTVTEGQENIISDGQTNTITGGQINNITGDQTTTITGNKTETVTENVTEDYKKDLTTTVGGNEIHEVKGTKTETVEGKLTENFKGGQETNVTGDQTTNVSGTQTTTATDINRNASSGMIDTIDNDYGTNKETKVAGETKTEVSIKGTDEKGEYIRGATQSRDYLIKGTLKNEETKTAEVTSTEITDGNNTASTKQDAKNLMGSVTNGTETGVSGIHANDDDSVSIDSSVAGGGMSSVINQKKDSIQSAVGDGTSSTVILQDKDNVTIASSNGTVAIGGKDIVNNAQDTITNTAGTKITDTAGDSTVTTEKAKGTTFTKTGSTAYSTEAGAPKDTNIAGNLITTGRVDANELRVSDKDGDNSADLSVKAGEGVKASAGNGTTTGSLDVTADEVKTEVKDDSTGNSTNTSQTADGIKGYATDKDGNKTYTTVTATENSFQVQDKDGNIKNHQVNTKDKSENTITNGDKTNTVTSTADGTTFNNSKAATPVTGASGAGTAVNTTIKGNTITTGKVTMDYADVMKDLGVRGNANITGKTTTGSLEVTGTSTLKGDVTMESNATVKKDLTVDGITTTKTLKVTENAEVDGTLKVAKKATFEDSVSIAKDLSVGGDVTAKSYKVGGNTYIDANGIHANNQKITDVADGSISEGSKDAVNGGQLYTVKNDLEGKVDKVGANAAAMANLHPMEFDPSSKWNIAAAIGNYGSETAAALGAFYRPNDDVMVNLSTAFGTGENMVGGGVSVRLGKGGNKLSREESNALKAQVNDLTARMDALLSVLNPNMSKDFPDVPENHWAYEAVSRLAGNDIVQGYPDGEFHGERTMTRYEMAEIIYNALSRGAEAEKELVEEFKPELQAMAASEKATAERAEG